jgi:hypothetical protein
MYTTLSTSQYSDLLRNAGFSYAASYALIEYLEEYEESSGEEIEFDAVALRCDYTEFESVSEAYQDHFPNVTEEKTEEEMLEELQDNYTVITFEGGVLVSH